MTAAERRELWRNVAKAMLRAALRRPLMPPRFIAAYLVGSWEAYRHSRRSLPPKTWPNGHPVVRLKRRAMGASMGRYGVGADPSERMWQTDDLDAAYVTAGAESVGGTAVVVRFEDDGSATTLATYRDGQPDTPSRGRNEA